MHIPISTLKITDRVGLEPTTSRLPSDCSIDCPIDPMRAIAHSIQGECTLNWTCIPAY